MQRIAENVPDTQFKYQMWLRDKNLSALLSFWY